jgi:hypothetical protein
VRNGKPAPEPKPQAVALTLRNIEMAIQALKIWRQVMVSMTFAEFRKGKTAEAMQELTVDIDQALEKFEKAAGQ